MTPVFVIVLVNCYNRREVQSMEPVTIAGKVLKMKFNDASK